MKNKQAQVTLFIILAIILVVVIALFFYLTRLPDVVRNPSKNPGAFLDNCIKESLKESEEIILTSNGFPEEDFKNYILYNSERVPYLCSVSEYYSPCVPQEPALLSNIEQTIENKLARDVESCFSTLKEDFEAKSYLVSFSSTKSNLSITKGAMIVSIEKKFAASKDSGSYELKDLKAQYGSDLYDLIKLEQTIVNYESTLCEFDLLNWNLHQSNILVYRYATSD